MITIKSKPQEDTPGPWAPQRMLKAWGTLLPLKQQRSKENPITKHLISRIKLHWKQRIWKIKQRLNRLSWNCKLSRKPNITRSKLLLWKLIWNSRARLWKKWLRKMPSLSQLKRLQRKCWPQNNSNRWKESKLSRRIQRRHFTTR